MANEKVKSSYNKKGKKYGIEGNVLKPTDTVKKQTKPSKNVHEGHRERLRERFLKEGLENFEDHNILELLLFYSIPVKDTNEEAHRLIERFGSLSEVFDAKYEDLCTVKGIGEKTALLIKLMPELFNKYEVDKLNKGVVMLNNANLVAEYSSKYFKGLTNEKLYAMYLDSNCQLLDFQCVGEGNATLTPLNTRKLAEYAYKSNAVSVILIHNHPSGIMAPSKKDIDLTMHIADLMAAIGIRLDDHVIIGNGGDFFSFRKSDKWRGIFR